LGMNLVVLFGIFVGTHLVEANDMEICDELMEKFQACTKKAYNDYAAAWMAGDDGWADWMARKSCNYMTAAVEDCGNMLVGDCNTEEEVTGMKDHQLKGILAQLQSSVEEWDSDKCPPVKAHILRMKARAAKQDNLNYEEMIVEEVAEVELQGNLDPEDVYEYDNLVHEDDYEYKEEVAKVELGKQESEIIQAEEYAEESFVDWTSGSGPGTFSLILVPLLLLPCFYTLSYTQ